MLLPLLLFADVINICSTIHRLTTELLALLIDIITLITTILKYYAFCQSSTLAASYGNRNEELCSPEWLTLDADFGLTVFEEGGGSFGDDVLYAQPSLHVLEEPFHKHQEMVGLAYVTGYTLYNEMTTPTQLQMQILMGYFVFLYSSKV